MQQMAQGLASLGRGQDSMLVHMTPGEVHGLQSLAQQHGGSLTINPHTGLPEAGFLSSILPMAAGLMLGPAGFGLMSAGMAGLTVGGLTALASGDLKKGLFAGLGAYGGAGIGESLTAAAPAAGLTPVAGGVAPVASGVAPGVSSTGNWAADMGLTTGAPAQFGPEAVGVNAGMIPSTYSGAPSAVDKMYAGAKEVFSSPSNALNFAKANAYPLAAAAAGPVMGMLGTQNTLPPGTGATGPQNFANYAMKPMQYDPRTGKYSNPTYSPVNYSTAYSPNMAYAAGGGSMQDIQANSQPVMPPNQELGGATPNQNQFYPGANIARGGASYAPPSATDVVGGYDQSINQYTGEPVRMAGGGVTYNQDDQTYSGNAPSYGSETLSGALVGMPRFLSPMLDDLGRRILPQIRQAAPQYDYNQNDQQYTQRMAGGGLASLDTYAAGGRLLQGPGDGMSDSIPAVIGGAKPQRAALAQGEFVVPADVVSHIGNGSTDAGYKRLYAMMDKVRHSRTGNKKQGRQINPDKFMPA